MLWWGLVFTSLLYIDYNPWYILAATVALGVGFPLACELDRRHPLYIRKGFFSVYGHWETAELYYGFMQDIVIIAIICSYLYS
jgi:hypothetical protein